MKLSPHTTIILLLLLLHVPDLLYAQWSDSSSINNPVAPGPYGQADARIVADGSGGVIIAWREYRPTTGYDIYAGRIDTMGTFAWAPGGVAICSTATDVFDVRMSSDGAGGAVIAWRETRGASGPDIYAQRIDRGGIVQWQAGGVAVSQAADAQDQPQLTGDGSGGAVIAWRDFRNGTDRNIFAQRIDSSGAALWTADGIPVCETGEDQSDPRVASDGGGGAVIVWEDYRSSTSYDIYAQRVNWAGAPVWVADGIAVSYSGGDQVNPRIATDHLGRAVIAWEDARSGTSWDVYAQRLSPPGGLMWTATGVPVCTAAQSQTFIDLSSDGTGGAFVVWQDDRDGLSTNIHAQRLNSFGGAVWTPGGAGVCLATNHQFSPKVVSAGSGSAIVAWHDLRNGTDYDIFAQRIEASGSPAWTPGGEGISNLPGDQLDVAIVADEQGSAVMAWKDGRNGVNNLVYAQNVLNDGSLGMLPWIRATSGPNGSISPSGIVAVPRGGSLTVTMTAITGFHIDSVYVNGVHIGAPGSYTFEDVRAESTIHAVFAINVYTVTATASPHGSISSPGVIQVVHGQTQAYAITPDPGYRVGLLLIDGIEVPATTYYIFINITTNRTIDVLFIDDSTALAPVNPRWNIVSVPIVPDDFSAAALFPSGIAGPFLFDGAYQGAPVMENGKGYWMKFDTGGVLTLRGAVLHLDTIEVVEGWNLVGSIGDEIPVENVESVPAGIVTSQFFGYDWVYFTASTIRPCRGYWVKVSGTGQLVFPSATSASPANRISIVPMEAMPPPPPGEPILAGDDDPHPPIPTEFRLAGNYPNPFNPSTVIRFELPEAADISLGVYSVTGERVATIVEGFRPPGVHAVVWDASGHSGGVYFCRLVAGPRSAFQKLLLVK